MNARVWTRAELDRVHPLPDGWSWDVAFGASPVARHGTVSVSVWVDEFGELTAEKTVEGYDFPEDTMRVDSPAEVALAVILASQGLDSRESMAAAIEESADVLDRNACGEQARLTATIITSTLRTCAAMLRRGTVPT